MEKVEQFIQEHTRNCSNQYDFPEYFENGIKRLKEYQPWLTPDHARKVAQIAQEETIKVVCEWLNNHYRNYMHNPTGKQLEAFFGIDMIEDLKKQLKGELPK